MGGSLDGIPGSAGTPCTSCSLRRTVAHSVFGIVRHLLSRCGLPPVSWQRSAEGDRQPVLAELDWPLSAGVCQRRSHVTSQSTSHAGREMIAV